MSENSKHKVDVNYVMQLARLELNAVQQQKLTSQMEDILSHFDSLAEVDVEGIEPTAHAFALKNVLQEDVPGPTFSPEEALMNAPAQRDDQIIVPKVVE